MIWGAHHYFLETPIYIYISFDVIGHIILTSDLNGSITFILYIELVLINSILQNIWCLPENSDQEQSVATGGGSGVNRVAMLGELELRRRLFG